MEFRSRPVAATTLGERLTRVREDGGISIEAAAAAIKVHPRYIVALESGQYGKLPGPLYAKRYLTAYARFLGVSDATIAREFEHEYAVAAQVEPMRAHPRTGGATHQRAWVTATLSRRVALGLAISGILLYLGWEAVRLLVPPPLVLSAPMEPLRTTARTVVVAGRTAPEATVTINGDPTLLDARGRFSETIDLTVGENVIAVTARRARARARTVLRHITVTPSQPQARAS